MTRLGRLIARWFMPALAASAPSWCSAGSPELAGASLYHERVKPVLTRYCFDCHGDGMQRGGVAFDEFESDPALLADRDLWWRVLTHVRAGLMPPTHKTQPPQAEKELLAAWIKSAVFQIDSADPDPGRVTVRRLNRVEFRNTIRDLTGVDFDTGTEFPPDDTGYGFDHIGDVLTVSPLLMEKYLAAAQTIISEAFKRPDHVRSLLGEIPENPAERREHAREVLGRFASRAFRRPADRSTVERLTTLAESIYVLPGHTFESGIAGAMQAVIASPRFLFRIEETLPGPSGAAWLPVDEYSVASRLSYFLWSTMPDDELMQLAERGALRKNLAGQVNRMLADPRSDAFIENFVGQWLEIRDLDHVAINVRAVLARDGGTAPERARWNRGIRLAMKREAEMLFAHVAREDRKVTELIDGDYTFLNGPLARFYGLTNLNVTGSAMRRVSLPPESPRGGVLTAGAVLVVTSNPDRTSPVKRGLFVLNKILGTPPPPPPPDIPALEVAEKRLHNQKPTLRTLLELHRADPSCASCHKRMDPIGLGLENFNALGLWRESERGESIDPAGKLVTGESFETIGELKRILATDHRADFFRCLTEKLLTYALGRGLEYYDVETVDQIVRRLEEADGRFSVLLSGVIDSAPFQKQRVKANPVFQGTRGTTGIEASTALANSNDPQE